MTAGRDYHVGPRNILLAGGTRPHVGPLHAHNICAIGSFWPWGNNRLPYETIAWAHIIFCWQDEQPIAWAHSMRIAFMQLVQFGPSRAWMTAGQDYRVGLHNILLVGGTRPRVLKPAVTGLILTRLDQLI